MRLPFPMARINLVRLAESERQLLAQLQAVRAVIRQMGGTPPPIEPGELDIVPSRPLPADLLAMAAKPPVPFKPPLPRRPPPKK